MPSWSSFRRRWPEAALILVLVLVAVYANVLFRSLAIVALGAVVVFAIRRRLRHVAYSGLILVALIVGVIATTLTIDLGSLFGGIIKDYAEIYGSKAIERPLRIGRLALRVGRGDFVVENLRIDGVKPTDVPFFTAKRILIAFPWWRVVGTNEFFVQSVEMNDWTMQVEKFENGNNLPRFKRDQKPPNEPEGPKRFTTTVKYVHAYRGAFTYIDHGTWRTTANNLDIYVRHHALDQKGPSGETSEYRGTATITDGVVQIREYLPMRTDMRVDFKVEPGGLIRLPKIVLDTDGSHSLVNGYVDFGHWPEMVYNVDSSVDLYRMRELYFANESWRSRGEAKFKGVFHVFDGGHLLKGDFAAAQPSVNLFKFPDLRGSLEWEPHRFEVTHATARFYDGTAKFRYLMAPLSDPRPGIARWDVTYDGVDLSLLSDAIGLRGLRMLGRARGHNLLEWPLGKFSDHKGAGEAHFTPPSDRTVLPRVATPDEAAIHAEGPEIGPEPNLGLFPRPTPIAGDFTYSFDPEWLDVAPSHMATERTYVEFQGRTAYGERSEFPFYARSADWQESDRLLAGILTAFGSTTGIIRVGGHGEFHGTMTKAFREPRIEGDFVGDDVRAWDVVWGKTAAHLTIEDAYVDVARGRITKDDQEIQVDGKFAVSFPRRDGGEEIYARFKMKDRDLRDLRHAFQLDDWPLDGRVSGEFRLSDRYTRPLGYGNLIISNASAWGEPFESATGQMRFVGDGVRIDAVNLQKAGGTVTGAAYVGWDGQYSFNAIGQRIPIESVAAAKNDRVLWSGFLRFSAGGAATFKSPRYDVSMSSDDLFVGEETIGAVLLRMGVREHLLTIEQLEAAGLGVSGSGQIEMTKNVDADVSLRFNNTLLDPYIRLFQPKLSPYVRATASGTIHAVGQFMNLDRLSVSATVESVALRLLDYDVRNELPVRLELDHNRVRFVAPPGTVAKAGDVPKLRLTGEGTRLDLSGEADLADRRVAVRVDGDANLGILQLFSKDIRSSGRATLSGEVTGSMDKPLFSGAATIADGRLRHMSLPQSLSAINGRVTFGGDSIRLEDISAQLAGGRARFGGRVEMVGFTPGQISISANAERMTFNYPEGFRSVIDAQLDLVGTKAAPTVRGTVTVRSAVYSKRVELTPDLFKLATGRASTASSGGVAVPSVSADWPVRFDVNIVAPTAALRVDTNVLRLLAGADLNLRGTYDRPILQGRAEVERGEALFEGKRYTVTHGAIDFNNPTKIEPYFDIAAEDAGSRAGPDVRCRRPVDRHRESPRTVPAHVRSAVAPDRNREPVVRGRLQRHGLPVRRPRVTPAREAAGLPGEPARAADGRRVGHRSGDARHRAGVRARGVPDHAEPLRALPARQPERAADGWQADLQQGLSHVLS